MTTVTPETKLQGIAQQMKDFSCQLSAVYEVSCALNIALGWYDDPDPMWGGPPSKRQLLANSIRLQQAYMNMAAITGLDPCEQFDDTKRKIRQFRGARKAGDKSQA